EGGRGGEGAEDETRPPSGKPRIVILGGGPNRIGQGIEFDYCCVQAAFSLRGAGYETVMINSNPEPAATDYGPSDHLFFQPQHGGSAIRCWSGRATCSAAGPWRSSTTTTALPATCAGRSKSRPEIRS